MWRVKLWVEIVIISIRIEPLRPILLTLSLVLLLILIPSHLIHLTLVSRSLRTHLSTLSISTLISYSVLIGPFHGLQFFQLKSGLSDHWFISTAMLLFISVLETKVKTTLFALEGVSKFQFAVTLQKAALSVFQEFPIGKLVRFAICLLMLPHDQIRMLTTFIVDHLETQRAF